MNICSNWGDSQQYMKELSTLSIFRNGYSFSFEDEGNSIVAWFSALTGKEKVFANKELVASQRNLNKNSTNSFEIGENKYTTKIEIKSLLKGPFICQLLKNEMAIKKQKLVFPQPKPSILSGWSGLLIYLLVGFSIGTIAGIFNWPDWIVFPTLILLFIILINACIPGKPYIEEVID